jgi:hypothetical protein
VTYAPSILKIEMPRVFVRSFAGTRGIGELGKDMDAAQSAGLEWPRDLRLITSHSPLRARKAVRCCAIYFRREFRFDFVQYEGADETPDPTARAYLWADDGHVAYGACCFRWRVPSQGEPWWALQWIWFHPYERERGHLKRTWPLFEARYGDFAVEGPISRAMRAFLKAMDPEERHPVR